MTPREAIAALHRAGRIAEPWLAGMLTDRGTGQRVVLARNGCVIQWAETGRRSTAFGGELALTDPATQGAVLALIREATGDAGAHIAPIWTAPGAPSRWVAVGYTGDLDYPQPTEEGAYAHLLEALATAQPAAEVSP